MSDTDTADALTVYSDYVCPFCYLGRHALDQYRASREDDLPIEWHPFDLRSRKRGPDGSLDHDVDDGKNDEYFERARQNVLQLREEYEATEMLDPEDVSREIDSFDAQVASLYVKREHPAQWLAFDEAIFAAHWEAGRDIGDRDVIADIAETVGLEPAEIRAAIDDEEVRASLRDAFETAHQRGVTGVPTFVSDGRAARGAVPPSQLAQLVEEH